MLQIDLSGLSCFCRSSDLAAFSPRLRLAHNSMTGGMADFTGWVSLPRTYDREEFRRIQTVSSKIQSDSEVLLVIGIGGSYLGARAVLDLLRSPNYNLKKKNTPDIYFTGNTLSSDSLLELRDLIGDRNFSINVISKSGTTTEPAIAFRFFRDLLIKKYGTSAAASRIYATTDRANGALKKIADSCGYETFVIPDNIGGRYSVLTAVGLLPIAVSGIDIAALMEGAEAAMTDCLIPSFENPAWQYAAARNFLYESGKTLELLACYHPAFRFFGEWWKQLFGESEGKRGKGLFPVTLEFPADLHSMGQYIQDGRRLFFETVVDFLQPSGALPLSEWEGDADGLNYLAGRELRFVEEQAMRGTRLAHIDSGVPNLLITLPRVCEQTIGALLYFFEFSCALSGLLLGINPFDQPGVEAYKKNMFALLEKPGFESERKRLLSRLNGNTGCGAFPFSLK